MKLMQEIEFQENAQESQEKLKKAYFAQEWTHEESLRNSFFFSHATPVPSVRYAYR